ncbi:N-acetylglucosamine-specific PTS transporter subunit IIBC [Chitinibacter tainanensis]|uniref:N-acetylglucosamine-specific PTS transporter subunit IIBC n=1 Tax=Chitinibacter tainanensis TaxID=230667 RepID=UPI002352FB4C|nr:N-acetylglucosamine-specific PTS transporter subunit IIBC [Chitinibacter tainanensis]
MNIIGYMQRIGRALMLPVATLPAAAILMGIGYWLQSASGGDHPFASTLGGAGSAIIDNMSILFAAGVAYGLSKDKDGAAAMAGVVGFLVLTTLLSPHAVALIQGQPLAQVSPAFGKINNQFIGILCGVIAATLYNRFAQTELPAGLAFFSGKRLVPILVSLAMLVLALPLLVIWPWLFAGLISAGKQISSLGAVGAGLFGLINRLLIPIGLHHAFYPVFWFDVAGINDIPNFLGGARAIAEGRAIPGVTGMYQAGFFPIMMFGLPGAALAIYQSAKPENRAKVGALMATAALSSIFTGITEPLEFAFMFAAPPLYVLHAVLTGLSLYIAASMHWMAGFGFSAGFVDLLLSSQNPLATGWYMLLLQGLVFFGLYFATFRWAIVRFNLQTPGREAEEVVPSAPASNDKTALAMAYLDVVGGATNLQQIDACITRLRLTVNDSAQIDEAPLKALGAAGVIKLDQQHIQIVLGPLAELIATEMKALLTVGESR